MKVLILGDLESNHTKRVVSQIIESPKMEVVSGISFQDTIEYYNGKEKSNKIFNEKYIVNVTKLERIRKIGFIIQFLRNKNKIKKIIQKYDLLNIQAVSSRGIFFLNTNKPIISSFWGSEIWEKQKIYNKIIQRKILKQSVLITVIHEKMKEKVLKEFGIEFQNKIRIVKYFMMDTKLLDSITNNDITEFKNNYGIPLNSKIITVSYSSAPRHRQDKILEILGRLDEKVIYEKNFYFIFPMTYGHSDWTNIIRKKMLHNKYKSRIILLDKYLNDKDIAVLRNISDVFINVPTQDSFSATMMEHLYTGSVVITGDWLPYDEIFNSKANIIKITDFNLNELHEIVHDVIFNLDRHKKKNIINKQIVKEKVFSSNWVDIFEEGMEIWKNKNK